jgi:DNA polymerase I-like protein with 3'-5' exonuclease and polymerase domains
MIYIYSDILKARKFINIQLHDGTDELLERFFSSNNKIALDTETTGLCPFVNELSIVQLSDGKDIHIIAQDKVKKLVSIMNKEKKTYIIHNAKFDLKFLLTWGLEYNKVSVIDTMLLSQIAYNGFKREHNLKYLLFVELGIEISKGEQKSFIDLDYRSITSEMLKYASIDVLHLHKLVDVLTIRLKDFDLKESVKLEMAFVKALTLIEMNGFFLHTEKWKTNITKNERNQLKLLQQLNNYWDLEKLKLDGEYNYKIGSEHLSNPNFNSPTQVKTVLKTIGYTLPINAQGKETTSKDKLKDLEVLEGDEFLTSFIDFKEVSKLVNSFGEKYFNNINKNTHRIHCNFKQFLNTGRLSSSKPNIQNLPKSDEVRSCFRSSIGYSLITCDYSSQEVILLSYFSGETQIIEAYKNEEDLHALNATVIYKAINGVDKIITKDEDEDFNEDYTYRSLAKPVIFALNYGGSAYTLQMNLGLTKEASEKIVKGLANAYSKQTEWQNALIKKSIIDGYITFNNVVKGKFFFPALHSSYKKLMEYGYRVDGNNNLIWHADFMKKDERIIWDKEEIKKLKMIVSSAKRKCLNYPIQASGSNIMKSAICLITDYLLYNNIDGKIVNSVHDELVVEVKDEIAEEVKIKIKEFMLLAAEPFLEDCPIRITSTIAKAWQK